MQWVIWCVHLVVPLLCVCCTDACCDATSFMVDESFEHLTVVGIFEVALFAWKTVGTWTLWLLLVPKAVVPCCRLAMFCAACLQFPSFSFDVSAGLDPEFAVVRSFSFCQYFGFCFLFIYDPFMQKIVLNPWDLVGPGLWFEVLCWRWPPNIGTCVSSLVHTNW